MATKFDLWSTVIVTGSVLICIPTSEHRIFTRNIFPLSINKELKQTAHPRLHVAETKFDLRSTLTVTGSVFLCILASEHLCSHKIESSYC
ncbi:hypothetical protein V1477_020625 [Vespula maculifrons]|uniref:Secreted protein n=1 Tax=Vespula maculifrons TaxID=7453 RepID=A0ABD2AQ76_VESMC